MSAGKDLAKEVAVDVVKTIATQVVMLGVTNAIGYLFMERRKEESGTELFSKLSSYWQQGHQVIILGHPTKLQRPVDASPEDEELARIISVFIARYKSTSLHGEKILSYKDILCMLGSDLTDILPKISESKRIPFQKLVDIIDKFTLFNIEAKDIAKEVYEQLQRGGCMDPVF